MGVRLRNLTLGLTPLYLAVTAQNAARLRLRAIARAVAQGCARIARALRTLRIVVSDATRRLPVSLPFFSATHTFIRAWTAR